MPTDNTGTLVEFEYGDAPHRVRQVSDTDTIVEARTAAGWEATDDVVALEVLSRVVIRFFKVVQSANYMKRVLAECEIAD